jgi:hypothetical protein
MTDILSERGIVVNIVSRMIQHGVVDLETFSLALIRIIQEGMWRQRLVPQTKEMTREFRSFEEFVQTPLLEGLGTTIERLRHLCYDNPRARDELDKATQHPPSLHSALDNVQGFPSGNSEAAALRRLRKDRPDLHQRVLSSELTAHGAMVEAGFRPRSVNVRLDDPVRAAAVLRRQGGDKFIDQLKELL